MAKVNFTLPILSGAITTGYSYVMKDEKNFMDSSKLGLTQAGAIIAADFTYAMLNPMIPVQLKAIDSYINDSLAAALFALANRFILGAPKSINQFFKDMVKSFLSLQVAKGLEAPIVQLGIIPKFITGQ